MPIKDKEVRRGQHKEYMRKYLLDPEHKRKHLARVKENGVKYRKQVLDVLAEFKRKGCAMCPEARHVCLDAHHLDPTVKEHNIGDMVSTRYSAKKVKIELDKCICVCKNCHAVIHSRVEQSGSSLGS